MDLLASHWEQPVISHEWQPLMKLVPGSASQLCLFHKVLARAWRCQGLLSPENGVIEQQNADNELLCLCCVFVITHVSDQNIKMMTKFYLQQLDVHSVTATVLLSLCSDFPCCFSHLIYYFYRFGAWCYLWLLLLCSLENLDLKVVIGRTPQAYVTLNVLVRCLSHKHTNLGIHSIGGTDENKNRLEFWDSSLKMTCLYHEIWNWQVPLRPGALVNFAQLCSQPWFCQDEKIYIIFISVCPLQS